MIFGETRQMGGCERMLEVQSWLLSIHSPVNAFEGGKASFVFLRKKKSFVVPKRIFWFFFANAAFLLIFLDVS